MTHNVGNTDKTVRIVIAIIIAATGIYFKSWWGLLAIVPLATAFTGFCPVYRLFNINTGSKKIKIN